MLRSYRRYREGHKRHVLHEPDGLIKSPVFSPKGKEKCGQFFTIYRPIFD